MDSQMAQILYNCLHAFLCFYNHMLTDYHSQNSITNIFVNNKIFNINYLKSISHKNARCK